MRLDNLTNSLKLGDDSKLDDLNSGSREATPPSKQNRLDFNKLKLVAASRLDRRLEKRDWESIDDFNKWELVERVLFSNKNKSFSWVVSNNPLHRVRQVHPRNRSIHGEEPSLPYGCTLPLRCNLRHSLYVAYHKPILHYS